MCPGLIVHKHLLSASQLSSPVGSVVHAWPPAEVFSAILAQGPAATLSNPYSGEREAFQNLVWLGDQKVRLLDS